MSAVDTEALLETPRLRLEPLGPDHAAELFEALRAPAIFRYLPLDPPEDVSLVLARCHRVAGRRSPDGRETWLNWVVRIRATGRCAGRLEATITADGAGQIAYLLAEWAQGQGYATEGCRRILALLFDDYQLPLVEARIDRRNARSIALVERLGFRLREVVTGADFFKGERSDEVVYVRARQPPAR